MIARNAQDLYDKINAVPSLTGKVGLRLGGGEIDPSLTKAALPCAWIIYGGRAPAEEPGEMAYQTRAFSLSFGVMLYIPYDSQAAMVATNLPLIDAVAQAVMGTDAPSGSRWIYAGEKNVLINPDRLAYQMTFEIIDSL